MDENIFFKWLTEKKNLSARSAKDVLSRARRICCMLNCNNMDDITTKQLNSNNSFEEKSMFVKSQLRRSLALYQEFLQESNNE